MAEEINEAEVVDCRFDGLIMSTCHKCKSPWVKQKVGQRHDCAPQLAEPDSTIPIQG